MTIDSLLNKIQEYNPRADFELIKKAYNFAEKAHKGQKRMSGKDYITHPLQVAYYLAEMKLGPATIAAALLHDVVDDTEATNEKIRKEFGKEIAFLVEGISKLGKIKYRGIERQVENLRKIFLAMAEDARVILIKFCDRLHNLETLGYLPKDKAKRIALESLEIYAPLAYRLGIRRLTGRLEDAAFPYAYPDKYQQLIALVKEKYQERKKYLKKIEPIIKKRLKKEGIIPLEIHSRSKRYYSLYKKLLRYDMNLNKIYDLVALRIIVRDIKDCYRTLGAIHKFYKPLIGRIKDYISLPKPNGYRSLHTTVFCEKGKIIEFQIRTPQMHKEAEYGIAAHWYYSEQKGLKAYVKKLITKAPEKEILWVKQLREWQKESKINSPEKYLESLKIDFLKDRIFIFTPKGDVIDLPESATPVDFAYAVHTEIGNHCAGARVNGNIASLSQTLKNGDLVEIIVNKNKNPSRDWLNFVKTNMAISRIKHWLKRKPFEDDKEKEKKEEKIQILQQKTEQKVVSQTKKIKKAKVIVAGKTGILTNLAKCCSPQTGDKIKAYITKDRGASIHKINCGNLRKVQKKWPQKVIDASWEKK